MIASSQLFLQKALPCTVPIHVLNLSNNIPVTNPISYWRSCKTLSFFLSFNNGQHFTFQSSLFAKFCIEKMTRDLRRTQKIGRMKIWWSLN